jgi:hypothetical protein
MQNELEELKRRIHALSTEELLDVVTVNAADYRSEAIKLAWDELRKREVSEVDVEHWRTEATLKRSEMNRGRERAHFLLVLIITAVVTFSIFAPIIYYSVVAYGVPAAAFIVGGYVIWLVLFRRRSQRAYPFAVGFSSAVLVLLVAYLTAVPTYVAMILIESFLLSVFVTLINMKLIRERRYE